MREIQCCIHRKWFLVCLLLGFLIVVSSYGCAGNRISVKNDNLLDEREGLRAAFNQYWRFIAGKEVEKAFTFEAPHVQEMVNGDAYRLYQQLFMQADLQEVEISDKKDGLICEQPFLCCFNCRMVYRSDKKGKDVHYRRDCWVLVDGRWYHAFRSPLFFPM